MTHAPMPFPSFGHQCLSIYRNALRKSHALPNEYLRLFFQVKFRDDIQTLFKTRNVRQLRKSKIKRIEQSVKKLHAASIGNVKAFDTVLDLAYGRKGKLRWELLQLISTSPLSAQKTLHAKDSQYSSEMQTLLKSAEARSGKPLTQAQMDHPPTLPERARRSSEEARLLGPLSKRREANIRWKFFVTQLDRVIPPLQVTGPSKAASLLEKAALYSGIEGLVGRQTQRSSSIASSYPARWLRRRYQLLLGRSPILTFSEDTKRYRVEISAAAISPSQRLPSHNSPTIDASSTEWMQLADSRIPSGKAHAK